MIEDDPQLHEGQEPGSIDFIDKEILGHRRVASTQIRVVYKTPARVANMAELFKSTKLGALSKKQAVKTAHQYHGTPIYKATRKIKDADGKVILKKNDHFYLDRAHGDHVEVFDGRGKFRTVSDLKGRVLVTAAEIPDDALPEGPVSKIEHLYRNRHSD